MCPDKVGSHVVDLGPSSYSVLSAPNSCQTAERTSRQPYIHSNTLVFLESNLSSCTIGGMGARHKTRTDASCQSTTR
eukprot:scaffold16502_cov177-Amphora_coffeaeformis.AAC.13